MPRMKLNRKLLDTWYAHALRMLLEKQLATYAVGRPYQGQWTIVKIRQRPL
jgi:hypothetical protein